jgi:hypothetical protein
VSSSQDDVVPHIIVRLSHLQLGKFMSRPAKRVLQQNLRKAAVHTQTASVTDRE